MARISLKTKKGYVLSLRDKAFISAYIWKNKQTKLKLILILPTLYLNLYCLSNSIFKYNVLVLFIYLRLFFCGHCDKKVVIHNTQSFSLRYNRKHSAEMSDRIWGGLVVSFSKRARHGKGHQSISCKWDVQGERTVIKRKKTLKYCLNDILGSDA